jgi:hypothetical protein
LRLPKGIKKLRESASEETLHRALGLTSKDAFNGFIRATAPKGVKEAGIVLFLDGKVQIAVYQSQQRSLYGPDALPEVKRVGTTDGAFIRVEEFFSQTMDEVGSIVKKMRKARVTSGDMEKVLQGKGADEAVEAPKAIKPVAVKKTEKPADGSKPEVPRVSRTRARVTDRITKSKEAAGSDDEDILKVLKEVGMSPPTDEEEVDDDEVTQYIAAFEDFLQKAKEEEAGGPVVKGIPSMAVAVDEIIDEMMVAATDDPDMMEFIENQRESILTRIASTDESETIEEKRDRLTHQQDALEHISKTFREVLKATEEEAGKRKAHLDEMRESGEKPGGHPLPGLGHPQGAPR